MVKSTTKSLSCLIALSKYFGVFMNKILLSNRTWIVRTNLWEVHRTEDLIKVLELQLRLFEGDKESLKRGILVRLSFGTGKSWESRRSKLITRTSSTARRSDLDIEASLARLLVLVGKPESAISLIQDQVNSAEAKNRSPKEIADLLIRLAHLQDCDIGFSICCCDVWRKLFRSSHKTQMY